MTTPVGRKRIYDARDNMWKSEAMVTLETVYPERTGFARNLYRGNCKTAYGLFHIGYASERMHRCECGSQPVLEQTVDDVTKEGRNVPAKKFVAICPTCESRTEYDGDPERCVEEWNAGRLTADSRALKHSIKRIEREGYMCLCEKVMQSAYADAVSLIRQKHMLKARADNPNVNGYVREQCRKEIDAINTELSAIQRFFHESPMMADLDPEGVISDIRKEIYPELKPEVRTQKPLELTKL